MTNETDMTPSKFILEVVPTIDECGGCIYAEADSNSQVCRLCDRIGGQYDLGGLNVIQETTNTCL